MKASIKAIFGVMLSLVVGGLFGLTTTKANADASAFDQTIETVIAGVNNEKLDGGNTFVMVLSETDYMTREWDSHNYYWYNAEDVKNFEDRVNIDTSKYNVCNAVLDQNASEYNYEEYVFIDGQALSEYAKTHPYKLIANKRTRVNTLSIDFAPGVLATISSIEVKAGCQFPTLSYGYFGTGESSCLLVSQDIYYVNNDGFWSDFRGYETGVEYEANDKHFFLSPELEYKTYPATPLDSFTDWFIGMNIAGEFHNGKALASDSHSLKGELMVVRFVNPIDASLFDTINLRVFTNVERTLTAYNRNDVTEQAKGEPLQNFRVRGSAYSYIGLTSAMYVDEDNMVREIVFEFGEDSPVQYDVFGEEIVNEQGEKVRQQFFFMSYNLSKNDIITEESLVITSSENAYDVVFRFNKSGDFNERLGLDTSKVLLNGVSLSQITYECAEVTANWRSLKSVYQIEIHLPKSYTGAGQIKNALQAYAGNSLTVSKGLTFPNGEVLEKSYTCHLYTNEKIIDCELATEYKDTKVINAKFSFVEGSDNLKFSLFFDKDVVTAPYYHVCEIEAWRSTELKSVSDSLYDSGISAAFIAGGYKSSLLDNILINGKTIGEWHAHESNQPTNIQVHYGNSGLNAVDIFFAQACPYTYDDLRALVETGGGITIEVKEGLKFMVNTKTAEAQTFVYENSKFVEQKAAEPIRVYFNGAEVLQGDKITVDTVVSKNSIAVEGVADYQITHTVNGANTTYTITYGNETFTFVVTENITVEEEPTTGCMASAGLGSIWTALIAVAGVAMVRRRKYEK